MAPTLPDGSTGESHPELPMQDPTAPVPEPAVRRGWIRRLYDWTLQWADSPYGTWALFLVALVEASVFPIPPDVLLMALTLARPQKAFWYAGVCTAGSIVGAVVGWGLGTLLWGSLGTSPECADLGGGQWLFEHVPGLGCEAFRSVQGLYQAHGWIALFGAAFSPIPFKVFTIAAGVFQIHLATLLGASALGRAARFFLVAGLIWKWGPKVRTFVEKRLEWVTLLFTLLLVAGFVLVKYVIH